MSTRRKCIALLPGRIRCSEDAETDRDFCPQHGWFSEDEVKSIISEQLGEHEPASLTSKEKG